MALKGLQIADVLDCAIEDGFLRGEVLLVSDEGSLSLDPALLMPAACPPTNRKLDCSLFKCDTQLADGTLRFAFTDLKLPGVR
jgi:hypothetical protein